MGLNPTQVDQHEVILTYMKERSEPVIRLSDHVQHTEK